LRLRQCIVFISKLAAILTSWIDVANKWLSSRSKNLSKNYASLRRSR
jgi:hypothetical protein